jgi:hypothetical protein
MTDDLRQILSQLLRDARDLVHDLGLGEYGYMDPRATEMVRRLEQASTQLEASSLKKVNPPG